MCNKKLTLKEKMAILEALKATPFDFNRISEFLSYSHWPDLQYSILEKVVTQLMELDTFISASYELLAEEEWEQVDIECSTPGGSPPYSQQPVEKKSSIEELKEKLGILNKNFQLTFECLKDLKAITALKICSDFFKVKTRNIQFFIFLLAKEYPEVVFGYLLANLKKSPQRYCPFFSSLLVRLNFDGNLKNKCYLAFLKYLDNLKPSKTINYLIIAQSLLYIHCFKEFQLCETSIKKIKMIFEDGYSILMNKIVVEKFCEIHDYKITAFKSFKNECLYMFPFDLPVSKLIVDCLGEDYILFK